MTVEIVLWLFGKPEWEIDTEKASPKDILNLGKDLEKRLCDVASMMKKLANNKWNISGGLYDIMYFKNISKKEATIELKSIGISPKNVCLEEIEDEK
jgi:hypothetical protein